MREIKYRAQRVDDLEWVYGHYTQGAEHFHYITKPNGSVWRIRPETVGEYTGLKDSKGKDIFEGDIIKVDDSDIIDMWMRGETGEVKFIPSRFTLCLKNGDKKMLTDDFNDCVTVVGNIYQKEI